MQRIEVVGNTVLWSSQEPLIADLPDTTVGSVHVLVDAANMKSIHMQVRYFSLENLPYVECVAIRKLAIYTPNRSRIFHDCSIW